MKSEYMASILHASQNQKPAYVFISNLPCVVKMKTDELEDVLDNDNLNYLTKIQLNLPFIKALSAVAE